MRELNRFGEEAFGPRLHRLNREGDVAVTR